MSGHKENPHLTTVANKVGTYSENEWNKFAHNLERRRSEDLWEIRFMSHRNIVYSGMSYATAVCALCKAINSMTKQDLFDRDLVEFKPDGGNNVKAVEFDICSIVEGSRSFPRAVTEDLFTFFNRPMIGFIKQETVNGMIIVSTNSANELEILFGTT